LKNQKTIETRTYPVPAKYLGKELLIVETPGRNGDFKSRIVGTIVFSKCFKYATENEFYADFGRHKVSRDSPWAWTKVGKWGWIIKTIKPLPTPITMRKRPGIRFTRNLKLY
jgi:hypothetical protein